MNMQVTVTRTPGPGPRWWVEATDGEREWSDSYFTRREAEEVAADIEQGLLEPWEDEASEEDQCAFHARGGSGTCSYCEEGRGD